MLTTSLAPQSASPTAAVVESVAPDFADLPEEGAASVVRIFYGTNRQPTGRDFATDPNNAYGSDRGVLQFGVAAVSIPPTHDYGQIERPSVWRFEFRERADQHVVLRQIAPVSADRFSQALRSATGRSRDREAFVFVHGYNNDFAEAARRTAQIKHDLDFDGPAILFSWPSRGTTIGYGDDREQIAPTLPALTRFLALVAQQSGANRVHVIAHSMGNEFATRAIAQLSSQAQGDLFDQLILAAPDIDAMEFATVIAPYLYPACRRCTIYAADHDLALAGSRHYHRRPRLGQAGRHLVTFPAVPHINVVDASEVSFDLFNLGHTDFGDDLLADIRGVMHGLQPAGRKLQPHHVVQAAWRFEPGLSGEANPNDAVQQVSHERQAVSRPTVESEQSASPPPHAPVKPAKPVESPSLWARFCDWWTG